ncbi:MAG: hypothetical protein ACTSVV_05670 [Promethearchaeota archaeon]
MKEKDNILKKENAAPLQKFEINGKDLTAAYINDKLNELKITADAIIEFALWRWEQAPDRKENILNETKEWLNIKIGQCSIGPATSAAEPLLRESIKKLESLFSKNYY